MRSKGSQFSEPKMISMTFNASIQNQKGTCPSRKQWKRYAVILLVKVLYLVRHSFPTPIFLFLFSVLLLTKTACGIPDFTESIRQIALSKSSFKHPIKFLEAEYRPVTPVTVTSSSPELPDEQSFELQNLKPIIISGPMHLSESTGRREIKLHKFKGVDKNDTRAVEASFV
jgi:hypothetical protein